MWYLERFGRKDSRLTHFNTPDKDFESTMANNCDLCGKQFPKPSKLKIHYDRNHKCNLCFKEYLNMQSLKEHKKSCEKYKVLERRCQNCGKMFKHKGGYERHISGCFTCQFI